MGQRKQRDPVKERWWRKVIQDWERSGMSRTAFCQKRGISRNTFDFWRREIRKRDAEAPKPSIAKRVTKSAAVARPVLMPVTITAATPLEIRFVSGTTLLVPAGVDPTHLQRVMRILEGHGC